MLFSGLSSPHIHESARGILIGGMYLLAQVATFLGWLLGYVFFSLVWRVGA